MNGCMCDCGGWGSGSRFAPRPTREERIAWLQEYQRDLEQRAADVADEVTRLTDRPPPANGVWANHGSFRGQCMCPTDEYEKLASMEVEYAGDRIRLRLESKPGEMFDTSEIAACLDYTTAKLA
jgi:hypothetical protein